MKRKLLLFFLMFIFITNVSALTFDVNLTNIEDNGSDNFGSIENIDIPNKKIDILFEDLTSIVKFKISITNSGNKAGTLKSIGFNSSNDYIKYTSNLPEDGLSIDAEGTNTVIVTASLKEGATNGSSSSTIKITYNFDEGTCPEGEILSEDESMCLCPAGKGRNEDGICEALPINYRITYDLNGGSLAAGVTNPATFTVESDDITLNNPSKQGYTFTGWTGGGYSEPTVFVTIPSGSTGSRTYTANYEINSYILTVNPNGGIYNGSSNPVPIPNDYGTVITLDTPTRLGYTFNDWTLDGKGSLVGNSYTYTEGNGTLTANYTINTYDITYEGLTDEEKAALNLPSSYTVEDEITLTNPSDRLDSDGDIVERFTGWTIDGSTSIVGTIPRGSTGDKTITANFTHVDPDTYTITYNLNGGSVAEDNPTSYTKKTNTFTLNNPTKEGYDFAGWTGTGLSEPTVNVTIPTGSIENREYTANYSPKTYTITYEGLTPEEITALGNPTTYTIETDTFTLNNPAKEGYTFTGWTGSNGTTPGDVTINKGSTGEKTYTANYAPIKYSITYYLDGGSISEANPTTFTIESDSITLHNPTKKGYTFLGWTGTGLSELTENLTIDSGSIGDREYIANYKRIACDDDEIYNESKNICEKKGITITPSNPKTEDNIILITLLFIVSGLGIYASIFKKIKTYKQKKNVGIAIGIITFSLSFIVLASFFGLSKLLGAIINPVTKKQEIVINVDEEIELIEKWDGECSLEVSELTPENIFERGSGSEQDPYQIKTGEQLSCFAKSVNNGTTYEGKFVKQTKNIDLSTRVWTPIGYGDNDTEIAPFKGTYDGNNKAITNLFITSSASSTVLNQNASMGLFGFTYNSTIKNLIIPNVAGSSSNKTGILIGMAKGNLSVNNIIINNTTNGTYAFSSSYAGGLISTYSGNDEGTLTIENVTNNLNIGGCKDYCSGIVSYVSGVADSTEPNIIFRNIINNGRINSSYIKYVGGIVGYIDSSNANVLFDNCSNNANIYPGGTQNDHGHVGGIAGYISANKVVAKDSSNSGLFEEYSIPNIGGLFGSVDSNYFTATNLDNTGTIHCGNRCSGIIGYLSSGQISEEPNFIFRNISNNGEISSTKMYSVGGIIGEISSSQSGTNILIDNCSNGQRIYNYGGQSGNEYVGGLAGYITTKVLTISNSNNEGKLDNMYASNVGGLVGRVDSKNLIVDNSYNIGDIDCNPSGFSDYSTHGSSSYGFNPRFTQVGGLFGKINDPFTITNTYNTGNISGPYYITGGIVGFAYGTTSTIENSYNTGNITGAYQTGGLAGYYNDIINKSYNTGDIVIFSGHYAGGLIGFGQGKIYESYNTGNIAARTYSGEYVGGLCSSDCQHIQNSYNRGNIEIRYGNWSYVGGISGRSGELKNVYNAGNIVFLDNKSPNFDNNVYVGGIDGNEASSVQNGYNLGNITLTQNSNQSAKTYELSGISTINSYGSQEISNSVNTGNITFIVKYPNLTTNNRIDISGISVRSGKVTNSFNSGILTIDDSNLTTSLDDTGLGSIKYIGEIQSGYNANSTGNKFKNQSGKALGCYGIDSSCTLEQNNATGSYTTENVPSILSIINGDNKFNTELDEYGLPTLKAFND